MTKAKKSAWAGAKVGLVLIAAIAIVAVTIVKLDEKKGLFSDSFALKAFFPRINGLTEGAPVWLAGVDVGSVTKIDFIGLTHEAAAKPSLAATPPPKSPAKPGALVEKKPDTDTERIEVWMDVQLDVQHLIRENSVATIETQGLLGAKLISLTVGSKTLPMLKNGDVISTKPPDDLTQLFVEVGSTVDQIDMAVEDFRKTIAGVELGKGTVGQLLKDDKLYHRIFALFDQTNEVLRQVVEGGGTTGKFISDPAIHNRLETLIAQVQEGKGTLGKLLNDEALYQKMNKTVDNANDVIKKLNDDKGSLGKFLNDDEVHARSLRVLDEMEKLLIDIQERPERYIQIKVF